MKKLIALLILAVLIAACLCSCSTAIKETGSETDEKAAEIVVFAAASMTETLEKLEKSYVRDNPNVKLSFNFDSSGTLKTQIEEGAVCDVFISAAQKQMNSLEEGGYIDSDTKIDLLENKVALCVSDTSDKDIRSFDDMKAHLEAGDILMAIGNEDVPVGQYTGKLFAYYGLDEEALAQSGVLTYGSNVKEVASQVAQGAVDCGIIYRTDAYSAGLTVADTATGEMCGQVIYPAAVLKESKVSDAAKKFLEYLRSDEASAVFEEVGFTPVYRITDNG